MKRVVVIGAGIVGASTAFRLAQSGADVTILDRAEPGSGTTGNSFAWVNANQKTPRAYFELNFEGMREHDRLSDELGEASWLHRVGNLVWTGDPVRYDELIRRVERLQSWGYNAQWLSASDVNRNLEPLLQLSGPTMRIAWFPNESWLDGPLFVESILRRARQTGATVHSDQEVESINIAGAELQVSLSGGDTLVADAIVNAAGPSADRIAAMVGRSLPLAPTRGLLVRVEVGEPVISRIIHATDVNMRPDGDGYVLLHHDSIDPLIGDIDKVAIRDDNCRELCRRAKRILPDVTATKITETRVGIRPYPRDNVSCVGEVPSIPGYYEAVTHSGVTLGPLIGRLLSAQITDGQESPLLDRFRAARF